jgi:3-deoxy-D-manno-octulosonic-acid transferase
VALYRIILALALPFLVLATVFGRWPKGALAERLGFVTATKGGIWVHAASVGEAASLRRVVEALARHHPVFMTVNTTTARSIVAGWGTVQVAFAPFDTAGAPARLISRLQPRAHVLVESELWPARMAALAARCVPVIMLGARMSEGSARRWGRLGGLMRRMLGQVRYLSAQDAASEVRFVAQGLPEAALGPRVNLKAFVTASMAGTGPVPRTRCVLAASTHEGEDAAALQAFKAARGQFDLLILAPRHPQRGDAVARVIAAAGLAFGRRSKGDALTADVPVYLADTVGEMAQWYAMAGVTIMGGSYVDHGGHTPFEPAAAGSAIIHGPYVSNFAESYAALTAAGGALTGDLTQALHGMTPERQVALATAAQKALAATGDLDGLVDTILHLAKDA